MPSAAMSESTRRSVAFIAWRLITGRDSMSIYDHAAERKVQFSGTISSTEISIRDADGRQIVGSGGSGMYTLTDGGAGKPVTLKIDGLSFEGFDYGASRRYQGAVDRDTLRITDPRANAEFSYSIQPPNAVSTNKSVR
jgi:hypothetical protein